MLWHRERTLASPHLRSRGGQEQWDKSLRKLEREASESNQEGKGQNAVRGQVVCNTQRISSEDQKAGGRSTA